MRHLLVYLFYRFKSTCLVLYNFKTFTIPSVGALGFTTHSSVLVKVDSTVRKVHPVDLTAFYTSSDAGNAK
jgi:hypothetical protein